jgi:hypothetical protein
MPSSSSVTARIAVVAMLAISAIACTAGPPAGTATTVPSGPGGAATPANATPALPGDTPTPSGTTAYHSLVYGYTIQRPAAWTVTPATDRWPVGTVLDGHRPAWLDHFVGSWGDPDLRDFDGAVMAAQVLPPDLSPAAWTDTYARNLASANRDCKGVPGDWKKTTIGSIEVNRIDIECQGIRVSDVTFVVNGTGYVISGGPSVVTLFVQTFQAGA